MGNDKVHLWETLGRLGDVLGLGALHVIFRREDQRTKAGVESHRQLVLTGKFIDGDHLFVTGPSLLVGKVDLKAYHLPLIQMGLQLTELGRDGAMEIHTGAQKQPGIGQHRLDALGIFHQAGGKLHHQSEPLGTLEILVPDGRGHDVGMAIDPGAHRKHLSFFLLQQRRNRETAKKEPGANNAKALFAMR